MRILITGGAGYIGSHTIIEILENTDWEVVSLDNHCNSNPASYDRIEEITGKKIAHVDLDLCDREGLFSFFKKERFDGVMHFAALKAVGDSVEEPLAYYKNNITGLLNLIDAQVSKGVLHHVYSSSCTVYGTAENLPVTEKSPAGKAESPYGFTKVMGEQILDDIAASGKIKCLALRYFNPVGAHASGKNGELPKGIPSNLIPFVTQTAAGLRDELTIFGDDYETRDGTCIRDYIHVTDIARAHIAGMKYLIDGKQELPFDYINLGSGDGVSVKEIVETFSSVNQVPLNFKIGPRRAGDVIEIYADNSKARNELGWNPEFGLEEMMRSAWKWQEHLMNQGL